jgi:hypothetical protein
MDQEGGGEGIDPGSEGKGTPRQSGMRLENTHRPWPAEFLAETRRASTTNWSWSFTTLPAVFSRLFRNHGRHF